MKNENAIIWLIYFKVIRQQIKFTQKEHFQENIYTDYSLCVWIHIPYRIADPAEGFKFIHLEMQSFIQTV